MDEEGLCNVANAHHDEHRQWVLKIEEEKVREVIVSTVTGINVFPLNLVGKETEVAARRSRWNG